MNQFEPNRLHSAIESAGELIAIFEAEAEFESAEQTRALLYYLLRDDYLAASNVLELLSCKRGEWFPGSDAESQIAHRLARLGSILSHSVSAESTDDEVLVGAGTVAPRQL